jgi:hypothetical protein
MLVYGSFRNQLYLYTLATSFLEKYPPYVDIGLGTREVLIRVLALCVKVSGALDTRRDLDRSDLRRHSIGIDSVTLSYGTDLLRRPCKSRVKVNNSLLKVS